MNPIKHKLFSFTWIGMLTFLAGAVNISAIILFETTISHHTGNLSKVAIALGTGQFGLFWFMALILGMFFLGSMISGYLFYDKTGELKILYVALPASFGIVLFVCALMTQESMILLMVMALGMGLQNGMFIRVRSILIRTTHMTGYLTDAAFSLGAILRGNTHELWKFSLYGGSILIFSLGGMISVWLVTNLGFRTLEIIALLYLGLGAFIYFYYPDSD